MKVFKFLLANAVLGLKTYSYKDQKFRVCYKSLWYEKYFTVYVSNDTTEVELFDSPKGIEVGEPLFNFLYKNPSICLTILWKAFKYYKVFINREKFKKVKSVDITTIS